MNSYVQVSVLVVVVFAAFLGTAVVYAQQQTPAPAPAAVAPATQQVEVPLTVPVDSTKAQLAYERQKNLNLILQVQIQDLQAKMRTSFDNNEAEILLYENAAKKANPDLKGATYNRDQDKWFKTVPVAPADASKKPAPATP